MLDRLRTPLAPAIVIALLALAPASWLGWTNEVSAVVWLPLRPVAHLGSAAASWLRPSAAERHAGDAPKLAAERDELLALVQRVRIELERAEAEIEALEGVPRPASETARPLAGRVVAIDPDGTIVLGVGRRHGVTPGDPVVATGGRLVGRVADPVDRTSCVVVSASSPAAAAIRARLGGDPRSTGTVLALLEGDAGGWRGEVDAGRIALGDEVRLDDPGWPTAAQGLLLGRIARVRGVPERPLRASIEVAPAWSAGDEGVVVVLRSDGAEAP